MPGMISQRFIQWRLHAVTPAFRRHVGYAVEAICRAHALAKMVISWSTGKDSTAMTHLVRSLYPHTPIMIQFDDCDWPTKRDYATRCASAQGWQLHEVYPEFSVWDRMKEGRIGEDNFCAQSHSLTRDAFLKPLANMQHQLGCNGVYMGLRAAESKARKAHLSLRGEVYQLANGEWRCCPLARWTSEDVFAYMLANNIEINPCYFNNRFLPPEEIRVSWAIPTPSSLSHGDMEHFRHYYPEQFRKMREMEVC